MVHQSQRRWSCDRCHALKERCRWALGSFDCERCARLGQLCQSIRPQRKPGRPRRDSLRHRAADAGPLSAAKKSSTKQPFLALSSSSPPLSLQPSNSTGSLKDPLGTVVDARASLVRSVGINDDLSGPERRPLDSILFRDDYLEQFVVGPSFLEPLTICGQTLSLVKPFYESLPCPNPADYGFIYCIVLTDLAECLFQTKRPTLRLKLPPGSEYIDRHIGLLATLLPYLHDICELSSAMLHGSVPACAVAGALDALELAIHSWRPPMPDGLAARFSATEVTHMFCQAHTTHVAAMLILHRLRHPFGSQLEQAQALASTILVQLDMTLQTTGMVPRCIDLPLIVACLELEDEAERARWLHSMSPIGAYSSPFHERVKSMLAAAWTGRSRFSNMYWYHLGNFTSLNPDFQALPHARCTCCASTFHNQRNCCRHS